MFRRQPRAVRFGLENIKTLNSGRGPFWVSPETYVMRERDIGNAEQRMLYGEHLNGIPFSVPEHAAQTIPIGKADARPGSIVYLRNRYGSFDGWSGRTVHSWDAYRILCIELEDGRQIISDPARAAYLNQRAREVNQPEPYLVEV